MSMTHRSLSPATAWALYDWANSAFATVVMAGFFPLFFKQYWAAGLPAEESTFWLGLATTLASVALILMAPVIGGLADAMGWRKRILLHFSLLGIGATILLWRIPQGEWGLGAGAVRSRQPGLHGLQHRL